MSLPIQIRPGCCCPRPCISLLNTINSCTPFRWTAELAVDLMQASMNHTHTMLAGDGRRLYPHGILGWISMHFLGRLKLDRFPSAYESLNEEVLEDPTASQHPNKLQCFEAIYPKRQAGAVRKPNIQHHYIRAPRSATCQQMSFAHMTIEALTPSLHSHQQSYQSLPQ
jgi:hypothetical protein